MFALDLIGDLNRRGVEQRVAVIHPVAGGLDFGADCVALGGLGTRGVGRLHRTVRQWRPDVVQAHGGQALKALAPTLLRPGFPPVVYRRIGMTPAWMAGWLRKRAHAFIIRRAEMVVAVAEAAACELSQGFGVPRTSIEVIGNAVDEKRVRSSAEVRAVKNRLDLKEEAQVVLFAGALTDEKDPLELVAVAARVCQELPAAVFVVAGDGPLKGDLTSAVDEAGLGDRVRLLGSRTDLPDLMRAGDALVMTSRTEGIPGVAIEAGLARRPVVAYRVGGLAEVVVDGRTGLLAERGDVRGLSARLIRILTDRSEAAMLGEAAQTRCRELYEIAGCGALYLDLYSRLNKRLAARRAVPSLSLGEAQQSSAEAQSIESGAKRSPLIQPDQDITLTGDPR
jgi:glycosyltransferase involved in cell wall biosynthesis